MSSPTLPTPFVALPTLRTLTLQPLRVRIAQAFVVICFVWPFFNFDLVLPGSPMEIDFLPVLLACILVPEMFLCDLRCCLLSLPVFAIALLGASLTAAERVGIGVVPLLFLLNFRRFLDGQGKSLVPRGLAYRCLQAFVAFSALQAFSQRFFPVIPPLNTDAMTAVVPRYSSMAYDQEGIRGVQGWASEPSSAGLTCIAFALVALRERPERRWRILWLFAALVVCNKSIYALILGVLFALGLLFSLGSAKRALLALVPICAAFSVYAAASGRVAELRTNLLTDGADRQTNHELLRFLQILDPLEQFPHVYQPLVINGDWVAEPMGLLPLVAGYGSVAGVAWLLYVGRRHLLRRGLVQRPLIAVAAFVLLIMASPDFIPAIVALAVYLPADNSVCEAGFAGLRSEE